MDHVRTSLIPLRTGRTIHRAAPVAIVLVQQRSLLQQLVAWCAQSLHAAIHSNRPH
ncbi:MAG: hypothetical protein MUE88_03755 [Flavobacteriales bacterium]|nr:hypothetical protein [Flavobacteriales bacterium]